MALYDNKYWLLSHIKNSFISTDDTGMCEMIMVSEDFPKQLAEKLLPGNYCPLDDSDDDDHIDSPESYDIQLDMEFGLHRLRSNTAQRLEKLDLAQKKAAKVKHVKWEMGTVPLTDEERKNAFVKRDYKKDKIITHSLLTEQLKKYTNLPQNPYLEYAKFDGSAQVGTPTRKYKIFLTMLPEEQRNYPMAVAVIATAKVHDLIGLILLKCSTIHGDFPLRPVNHYGLYYSEDDGEIEDFPCLDTKECVAKFGFNCLALVEHKNNMKNVSFESSEIPIKPEPPEERENYNESSRSLTKSSDCEVMKVHKIAMEAPLYQSFKVCIINKMRTKTDINLGVSGEKIEIDPVQQKNTKFWVRQKPVSYHMDSIAWVELLEKKSDKATFRLVYSLSHCYSSAAAAELLGMGSHLKSGGDYGVRVPGLSHPATLQASASFKHYDFEADVNTAEEVVRKINLILDLRSSASRKEYLATREKKSNRRKSFHLGSRS